MSSTMVAEDDRAPCGVCERRGARAGGEYSLGCPRCCVALIASTPRRGIARRAMAAHVRRYVDDDTWARVRAALGR